jgi:O-acetyl-ADP-ribose deacetylase (regulator of RNase III)
MGVKLGNNKTLRLVKGDITERKVDAIVNAANSYLKHGGGVAAAIVRKGGDFVPVGSAVITTAGKLPCKAVIHTVGPKMGEGDEDYKLKKAVRSSLVLASEKGFRTVSMPAISSGIFGLNTYKTMEIRYTKDEGVYKIEPYVIVIFTRIDMLFSNPQSLEKIIVNRSNIGE